MAQELYDSTPTCYSPSFPELLEADGEMRRNYGNRKFTTSPDNSYPDTQQQPDLDIDWKAIPDRVSSGSGITKFSTQIVAPKNELANPRFTNTAFRALAMDNLRPFSDPNSSSVSMGEEPWEEVEFNEVDHSQPLDFSLKTKSRHYDAGRV